MSFELNSDTTDRLIKQHRWAATGVSDYPPRDPLVGQSRFFKRFQTFLHTVDHDDDRFAHVFAVEAEWGRGKSRLGHELVAQINDCSKGWFVRDEQGGLQDQKLFDLAGQDKYLALYIRYSQVTSDYQNSDNWFAFGLYQALLPLATRNFDGSIQSGIARQAYERLMPFGFSPEKLAEALQLDANHSEESLYEDKTLVVTLVDAAHKYLETFGIEYVLVVLDELETVAEAATFGLEDDDNARLDGQAIRLIGKAIKEEDPRRKLPWLRYVALCSPLLGQQLREIQSVARRFELVELEHNAFADVSDYVASLLKQGKLAFDYPTGLVEAAYAMSGANFGWFNVVMANVDAVLTQFQDSGRQLTNVGDLFEAVLAGSGRVAKHVLDKGAIEGIQTRDQAVLAECRELLYGQLPVPLSSVTASQALCALKNEDQEPVVALYRKLPLDRLQCRKALEQAKFRRKGDEWLYPAVDQALSLDTLLDNLRTFSIKEQALSGDTNAVLIPLSRGEFKFLLSLLYDHPAIEFAADALWQSLVGESTELPVDEATHIGPSVAMLLRLDLRYRNTQHNSMIFRELSFNDGHERAMEALKQSASFKPQLKFLARVTGLVRLLDNNWHFNEPLLPVRSVNQQSDLVVVSEPKGRQGGLLTLESFKLHPDGKALFAWVANKEELDQLHQFAGDYRRNNGRTPMLALTASAHLIDLYSGLDDSNTLRDDVLLHHVNPSEIDQLERIGLDRNQWQGFSLSNDAFTAKFRNKLKALEESVEKKIQQWRLRLNERGLIAWPLKVSGKLSSSDRDLLFQGWKLLAIDHPELKGLMDIQQSHGVAADELSALLSKLSVPGVYIAKGFSADEHAGLFSELDNPQLSHALLPLFLAKTASPGSEQQWTLNKARQSWYFGYVAESSVTAKTVFDDWMWWCGELNLLSLDNPSERQARWVSYPRSRLDNAVTEAQNWFSGDAKDSYRSTVEVLGRVYGYGRINDLFSPVGSSKMGYLAVEAEEQLRQAAASFTSLKQREEQLPEVTQEFDADLLSQLIKARAEVLSLVEKVKPLQLLSMQRQDANALDLEDKETSLYVRIEQARLFAEFVEESATRIQQRVADLLKDLEDDCHELQHFPKAFYSQCLRTVDNIIEGALGDNDSTATAKKEQQSGGATLSHYLRKLDLANAQDRLSVLATEVGINLQSEQQLNLEDVNGYILSSYRDCKTRFVKLIDSLEESRDLVQRLTAQLSTASADYPDQDDIVALPKLQQKLLLITDALEEISENAEVKRTVLRKSMQNGKFAGVREIPDQLLQPARGQLSPLKGQLFKIKDRLNAFKNKQLTEVNGWLPVIRPLLQAKEQVVPIELMLRSTEDLSLSEVQMLCDQTTQQWQQQAQQALVGTEVDIAAWRSIYQSLSEDQEPLISASQREALVNAGVLKMRLTFAK